MVRTHMIESLNYYEEMLKTLNGNEDELTKAIRRLERINVLEQYLVKGCKVLITGKDSTHLK